MHCDKHNLDYEQKEMNLCGHLMLIGTCSECDKEVEEKEKEKNDYMKDQLIKTKYEQSNIELMYYDSTLDNFKADTPELIKAKDTVKNLIETKTGKIIMLGKNGTGKTHLAVCAVKVLGGKILTMYEISTGIRSTYKEHSPIEEIDYVDNLANLKLLVIDEIGRTKGSEAEENWLSYIIDKRNSRSLPLILISNKHTRKTCKENGCKNCIENYLSEDILSRLCVDGKILNFTGDDFRKKK